MPFLIIHLWALKSPVTLLVTSTVQLLFNSGDWLVSQGLLLFLTSYALYLTFGF